jgi:hypothetical protein
MSDFSTLASAVKPSGRTTQYYVLSALYVLGGAKTPVTAAQVNDLLTLQLRGKAPANIPKLLRKYSADIRLAEKGPPLLWLLTDKGLDKLRKQSKLPFDRIRKCDAETGALFLIPAQGRPHFLVGLRSKDNLADHFPSHSLRRTSSQGIADSGSARLLDGMLMATQRPHLRRASSILAEQLG